MEAYTTEQEQLEEMRKWWKKNGTATLLVVAVGLAALAGTRWWIHSQDVERQTASALYDQVVAALEKNDVAAVMERGGTIVSQYSRAPYAGLAALAMAKVKYEQNDSAAAQQYLRWVLDNARDDAVMHVARLRLARVLLDGNQAGAALDLVKSVTTDGFIADYEELRGDIYVALNQVSDARRSYAAAVAAPGFIADRATLQMKVDDLGSAQAQQ